MLIGAVLIVALYVIAKVLTNDKNDKIEKVLYVVATCIVAFVLVIALWK